MGWTGCVRCEKFRRDFVARTFALVLALVPAHFAPSFVRQPNGPECTRMVQNTPKRQFRVQWGGSGAFVAKNSDTTSGHEFCTNSARSTPSFVRQPNGPECNQIVRNAPKRQFMVQCGGLDAFVTKNSEVTSWHKLLH